MKVGFSEKLESLECNSGKHKFLFRLKQEFKKNGIKITNDSPDIALSIPGADQNKTAKINVLRLDGLIINKQEDYQAKNNKILRAIQKSDALVYQNEFCQLAYERFLGVKNKRFACILNGASRDEFLPRKPKNYFIANCKWRPHKRLKTIVEAFIASKTNCELIVTGDVDNKIEHPSVKYLGWQSAQNLVKLLAGARGSFHLSWIDWCPNAMVEAVVAGCPVIYSDSGGHSYVGKNCGQAISDVQWDFQPCDYYHPPQLNEEEIRRAIHHLSVGEHHVANADLEIKNVARKYMEFFQSLLN